MGIKPAPGTTNREHRTIAAMALLIWAAYMIQSVFGFGRVRHN
jgi:hypothetical protein